MDLSKLDAVQKYAYTKYCRRGFVLRYFGDPAARQKCEGCDNCLGITAELPPKVEKAKVRSRSPGVGVDGASAGSRLLRSAEAPSTPTPSRASKPSKVVEEGDVPLDDPVFAALRTLRLQIAREEGVPAYIVFGNKTLTQIALKRPRTLEAFGEVHGVGPNKIERYGEKFVAEVTRVIG